jgi:phosphoesterase RecJ-like protein
MDEALLQSAAGMVQAAQRVLVVSHVRPDGDAVGSLLGFGLALQAAGKQVQMVLADGVPAIFRHLQGSDQVRHKPEGPFDLYCVLDCSDSQRMGEFFGADVLADLNIDHHQTNLNFARINLVDTGAVATAEMVYDLLNALQFPIPQPAAAALLTGLVTDTIGFRTNNVTPRVLRMTAELMEKGASLSELYQKALVNRSFEAARLWGNGLVKLEHEGGLVWTTLTLADRQAANYAGRDDADLVNLLSAIDQSDIAMIFVEQPNGHVKVSWRARPGVDVSQIAMRFGGGGHSAASGADVAGDLHEVRGAVLAATRELLNGNNSKDK